MSYRCHLNKKVEGGADATVKNTWRLKRTNPPYHAIRFIYLFTISAQCSHCVTDVIMIAV